MTPRVSVRRGGAAFLACGIFLVATLTGCATWSRHGIAPRPPEKIRVAVMPIEVAVKIKHLKSLETVPNSKKAALNEGALIQESLRQTAATITREFEIKLSSSYFFEVVPDCDVRRALEAKGLRASTATLTTSEIQGVGKILGADVVLVTQLSGYGAIKKKWLLYLVGSGLAEGLAQGVAAAAIISNPWAAVGIGVEEAAQETMEWAGWAYIFGWVWSPVILEGSLVSAVDGRAIWSGTSLESSNHKELKRLPKEEQRKREVRLRLTAQRAVGDLVKKIEGKAWANLKNADERPALPQGKTQ